jgi:aspartate 1-decarboxylase
MFLHMMKCKIHRASVTGADLDYEGSISLCPDLIRAAGLRVNEKVDIYNINNGARFHTYVIEGRRGDVCLNGAAARLVARGDLVIIVAYGMYSEAEASQHKPRVVFVDAMNRVAEKTSEEIAHSSERAEHSRREIKSPKAVTSRPQEEEAT